MNSISQTENIYSIKFLNWLENWLSNRISEINNICHLEKKREEYKKLQISFKEIVRSLETKKIWFEQKWIKLQKEISVLETTIINTKSKIINLWLRSPCEDENVQKYEASLAQKKQERNNIVEQLSCITLLIQETRKKWEYILKWLN